MVWGCFAGHKIGDLIRVRGIMKKDQYRKILENHVVLSAHRMVVRRQPVLCKIMTQSTNLNFVQII